MDRIRRKHTRKVIDKRIIDKIKYLTFHIVVFVCFLYKFNYVLLWENRCMTTEQEASPVMDITVRPISTIRSMPAAIATHSTGILAEAKTIAIKASDPPGMPGVPIEATVEAKAITKYC